MEPFKRTEISIFEEERFEQAIYEVSTIIPYVPNPEMQHYRMSKMELDDFLDEYNETAEFVIAIMPVFRKDDIQSEIEPMNRNSDMAENCS